jgi:hypothetical protein
MRAIPRTRTVCPLRGLRGGRNEDAVEWSDKGWSRRLEAQETDGEVWVRGTMRT